MIHVYPLNDIVEHDTESTCCQCGVKVDWSQVVAIVQHRALDGRTVTDASDDEPWVWDPEEVGL